jgi:hypothetical protein
MTIQDTSGGGVPAQLPELAGEGLAALLDRSIEEYGRLLREAPGELRWEHVDALDYALRHTVVRLLVRAAERDELAAAYDALRRLVPVEREDELAEWLPRWRAYADLLDARLASLAAREPEQALGLLHAREIVDRVAREPGLAQAELGDRVGLRPPNLSRILGVLEAHEFIERRAVGREKRVYLGRLGGQATGATRRAEAVAGERQAAVAGAARRAEAVGDGEPVVDRAISYLYANAA